MSGGQYTTLLEALKDIPDPRKARGKRYAWSFLLALICGALACGQKTPHAIAHWIKLHAGEIREYLRPPRDSVPSESTIRRALRAIDVGMLEERLARFAQSLAKKSPAAGTITTSTGETWQGQAVDGKELRGVRAHGQQVCLLRLVQHVRCAQAMPPSWRLCETSFSACPAGKAGRTSPMHFDTTQPASGAP